MTYVDSNDSFAAKSLNFVFIDRSDNEGRGPSSKGRKEKEGKKETRMRSPWMNKQKNTWKQSNYVGWIEGDCNSTNKSFSTVILLQSVSQISINKARWLFWGQFWPLLNRAEFLDADGDDIENWLEPKTKPPSICRTWNFLKALNTQSLGGIRFYKAHITRVQYRMSKSRKIDVKIWATGTIMPKAVRKIENR